MPASTLLSSGQSGDSEIFLAFRWIDEPLAFIDSIRCCFAYLLDAFDVTGRLGWKTKRVTVLGHRSLTIMTIVEPCRSFDVEI